MKDVPIVILDKPAKNTPRKTSRKRLAVQDVEVEDVQATNVDFDQSTQAPPPRCSILLDIYQYFDSFTSYKNFITCRKMKVVIPRRGRGFTWTSSSKFPVGYSHLVIGEDCERPPWLLAGRGTSRSFIGGGIYVSHGHGTARAQGSHITYKPIHKREGRRQLSSGSAFNLFWIASLIVPIF